ncbi:hypothetical protein DFR48_102146 [Ciceribacter lividus]|uniref:Uncharacterized protein n=1 Tax=Ciceribacter lividus TaxID=1197950 RepID=A0A6I7HSE2_9HYPH|nr:hypothetical protein [Ciceribacter lividus]RCW27662.1 hypothetical protein DFR48_102146 [Ciceribacter lividus]
MSAKEPFRLRIAAHRAGGVDEIVRFLSDINAAYEACYFFEVRLTRWQRRYIFEAPSHTWLEPNLSVNATEPSSILPEFQLELTKVSINSPGFWEFLGALNPLQQMREYLKDRHERLKDKDYRNLSEKERLQLENELLRAQVIKAKHDVLRDRVSLLREMDMSDQQIAELVWRSVGVPLAKLGRHQDAGLIGKPLIENEESEIG